MRLLPASDGSRPYPADVLEPDALKACVAKIESELGAIDLALLGAGMYVPFDIRNIDLEGFHRIMALNVDGVINAVAAVLPSMLQRKSGHIAIMGSLFGYAGWPGNGSYGASKAAVINLAESLKLELEPEGVDVTLINPGFVDTPLNASYAPNKKLYVMSKERCARKILERLGDKPYEIAFPPQVAGFLKTVRSLPRNLSFPLDPLVHQEHGGNRCNRCSRCCGHTMPGPISGCMARPPTLRCRISRGPWRLFRLGARNVESFLVGDRIWMHRLTGEGSCAGAARCDSP